MTRQGPAVRWSLLLALLSSTATPLAAQQVRYYHLDAIGSVRAISDAGGTVVERHDYLPFGEECTTGTCSQNPGLGAGLPRKFTGKERDAETGLDYFGARCYGSKIGRFTSVDPAYTWRQNLVDPLRWNRYAYVRNNPLRYTDPDGRVLDTIWDVGNLIYDVYVGATTGDWTDLGVDALATAIPFVPAGASKLRHLGKVDDAVDLMKAADKGADVSKLAGRLDDVPITMDEAVARGADHVGGTGVMETTGRGTNFQFRNTTTNAAGQTETRISRFDVNHADPHVRQQGAHLNIETQIDGRTRAKQHVPIDPTTVRRGDTP